MPTRKEGDEDRRAAQVPVPPAGGRLLRLTGDAGAELLSTEVVELQALRRSVDFVYRLRRGGETYLRHLEFQGETRADLLERCLEYNVLLLRQHRLPVLTTIVHMFPPAPKARPVHRMRLEGGGRSTAGGSRPSGCGSSRLARRSTRDFPGSWRSSP